MSLFSTCSCLLIALALAVAPAHGALAADPAPLHYTARSLYDALDRLPAETVEAGGSSIDIAFSGNAAAIPNARVLRWIETSARAIATYYGRFPVDHLRILVMPGEHQGIRSRAYGNRGAAIRLSFGANIREQDLRNDAVLAGEMVRLAFPDIGTSQRWLGDGVAGYVEPIARAQAGLIPVEAVWRPMLAGIQRSASQDGEHVNESAPLWERARSGGTLFLLLADIEIRRRTGGNYGLQEALRAILAAGGTIEEKWPLEKALQIGDAATGTTVLAELHDGIHTAAADPDLPLLLQRLGVHTRNGRIAFDDRADLAAFRIAITTPRIDNQSQKTRPRRKQVATLP